VLRADVCRLNSRHHPTRCLHCDSRLLNAASRNKTQASLSCSSIPLLCTYVFHITSEFAQKKSAYFKGVIRGQADIPLLLKFADLSERDNIIRYRAVYCGQTPYRISHIKFYAKFVMDFYDHYSVTFSNCLNYTVSLVALIINRETQAFTDPFRNGPFVGTLGELAIEATRRETLHQTGRRLPLCRAGMLDFKNMFRVWRIQGLTWMAHNSDYPTPRLCPLAQSPEYGIFPSVNNIYGKCRGMRTRFSTFHLDNTCQLMRDYKNTLRWYVELSPSMMPPIRALFDDPVNANIGKLQPSSPRRRKGYWLRM
jgi:hypothetical protein